MKRIKILNNSGNLLAHKDCSSQQEIDDYLKYLSESKSWGNPEILEEVLNENGEITTNSTPAEYEVLIEDCTAEVEQERINKEAKEYLVKTDYVVLKFAEALAKGESIEGLKIKYESVLENRAAVRGQIV